MDLKELQERIQTLEAENAKLRAGFFHTGEGTTVIAPGPFMPIFDAAQRAVAQYFSSFRADPTKGFIEISEQRYVLIRASALSVDFFETIGRLYADRGSEEAAAIARAFLFDISHSIGIADARNFHQRMGLVDPVEKLSAGPVHFSHAGWALVDIKPESNPVPDETFFLAYDHPYSFEADAWVRQGRAADHPVCIMNAGYSSGWCEESFGLPLTAHETRCRAQGHDTCSFVMAPPDRIGVHIASEAAHGQVPTFFERKNVEDALLRSEQQLRAVVDGLPVPVFITSSEGALRFANADARHHFADDTESLPSLSQVFCSPSDEKLVHDMVEANGHAHAVEVQLRRAKGSTFWALVSCVPVDLPSGERGLLWGTYDVSARKAAEQALERTQKQLAEASHRAGMAEVATFFLHNVGNVLNTVHVRASLANEKVRAMSSDRLHDLSTILPEADGEKVIAASKYLDVVAKNIDTQRDNVLEELDTLAASVLEMNNVVAAQKRFASAASLAEALDVEEAITTVIGASRLLSHPQEGLRVEVRIDPGLQVFCDRFRLHNILMHVVTNAEEALAFGENKKNHIRCIATMAEEGSVSITVQDTGIGIDVDRITKIFASDYSTKAEGRGLGLHMSALAAKQMGGQLRAHSEGRNCGATFVLTLPAPTVAQSGK